MFNHTRNARVCQLLLIATACLFLAGCRAMYTHDRDFSRYNNEQRRFYAPEKEAHVDWRSFAYRWSSGDLTGSCSQTPVAELEAQYPIKADVQLPTGYAPANYQYAVTDTIRLGSVTFFDTSISTPNSRGMKLLKQAIARIGQYDDVYLLEVQGHADARDTVDNNQGLSERRASYVARALREAFPDVAIVEIGFSELAPQSSNATAEGRRANRRATVTLHANQPREDDNDATLCNYAEPKQLTEEDYQRTLAALNERVNLSLINPFNDEPPLSVGDRIRLQVTEGEELSGVYEVGHGGGFTVPFLGFVKAHGLTPTELEHQLGDLLVSQQIFHPGTIYLSATVQEWSQVDVFVSGATFDPGRVTINRQNAEFRNFQQTHVSGDYAKDRLLSTALVAAGGIRPDADLSRIQVVRTGEVSTVDLSGVFEGRQTEDKPLAEGDQIIVPSTGYFNGSLVRRSQVTPPGIRIFISNLIAPAFHNSAAAINEHATSVPYGTRFLRGLVSSNCVGGAQFTNAGRRAVLISTNPITGRTEVIERSIQQLVSDPDRDDINPYLMPGDGIACYDSDVTNFREVMATVAETVFPLAAIDALLDRE